MKKYLNISLIYAVAAMAGGVFYREFTKFNQFTEATALGKVHTHLFLLGMVVFMLTALFSARGNLEEIKTFRIFMRVYNIGVPLHSPPLCWPSAESHRYLDLRCLTARLLPSQGLQVLGIS